MVSNPTLARIVEGIEAEVPQQLADGYARSVLAGMHALHNEPTSKYVKETLEADGDTAENIGEGIAKLVGMMVAEGGGKSVPVQALLSAGGTLLMHALDFASQAGALEVDNKAVATATKSYASNVLQILGWTPEKIEEATKLTATAIEQQAAQGGVVANQKGGVPK